MPSHPHLRVHTPQPFFITLLEDYVAAFLQCGGFYTEKSLIESGESTVMELDIMAWKPTDRIDHALVEVKGGEWGFSDVFKVYGWKTYLKPRGVQAAYLVAPKGERPARTVDYIKDKCEEIGIVPIIHDNLLSLESSLKALGIVPQSVNSVDHGMWRFSFWLERQMQKVVGDWRKDKKAAQGPSEVYAYQELIRNGFLQARNLSERLASMYQAHYEHPLLARSVATELDNGIWNVKNPTPGEHWREALYDCKHPLIHAALYHEHRAKLAILKGAVEFTLLKKHGTLPEQTNAKFLGIETPADFLPQNFYNAVAHLESIEGFEKVASLWQSFLWKWGGFFLIDRAEEEIAALADEVGMTTQAVSSAMEVYDVLFPIPNRWFQNMQGTKVLKLFPCQFRGIGVQYRCKLQGITDLQKAFGSSSHRYLVDNLVQWNNSTANLLQYGLRSVGP